MRALMDAISAEGKLMICVIAQERIITFQSCAEVFNLGDPIYSL